jgi:hypothetical protein
MKRIHHVIDPPDEVVSPRGGWSYEVASPEDKAGMSVFKIDTILANAK